MKIDELKSLIASAGVVGAGGAGFPTAFKLRDGIDKFIINAAECEPLIYTDYYLLKNSLNKVLKGAKAIMDACGIPEGFMAVKQHTAARLSWTDGQKLTDGISVHCLPDVYPMGDEIIMIYEVTGRIVPPGKLPGDVGCVVNNVETLYNVANAMDNQPVTEKWVTINGDLTNKMMIGVPIGTPVIEIFDKLGIKVPEGDIVVDGGPAMGKPIDYKTAVITKTTKSLLILPDNIPCTASMLGDMRVTMTHASSNCCSCTMCTELCPRALIGYPLEPHKIVRSVTNRVTSNPQDYLVATTCSGCGVCELSACCQGISPRKVYTAVKGELGRNRMRYVHPDDKPLQVMSERDNRMLPSTRFMQRIGVDKYDTVIPEFKAEVKIDPTHISLALRQHVGAPAAPNVKPGDSVKAGDIVGKAADGISANIHSSVNGVVESVDNGVVVIKRV
ncbi:4Fe-4S dicluster domain-containing protein [Massilioclostridium coli]|uniref:4Fe-4S dicluster domain-containing protein n=1 Tax=Massilioclostridium coli TaxID=1870991 RepID=UPI0022E7B1AC|nr:4Fe-4S dicluster domain-containing protein [Massilioclostridium coli]